MFGLLKMLYVVLKAFPALLDIDRNALAHVPNPTKYLAMILLACFWCLAFGIYFGELITIGYNMIGHIAIITMVFVTWFTFRSLNFGNPRGVDWLRMPDRSSRCDELTDEQRLALADRADEILGTKQIKSQKTKTDYYYGA